MNAPDFQADTIYRVPTNAAFSIWSIHKKDEHFAEADWVGKKFNWLEPLVDEARKLIATLDQRE